MLELVFTLADNIQQILLKNNLLLSYSLIELEHKVLQNQLLHIFYILQRGSLYPCACNI